MPDALQIRAQLADWIEGRISLAEFEDWFVPATWNIHHCNDPEAEDLADEIELSLSEYSGGYLSASELRDGMRKLLGSGISFALREPAEIPRAFSSSSSQRVTLVLTSLDFWLAQVETPIPTLVREQPLQLHG
ncbi:hypothetical protein SBA3_3410003 [Candidatus Sulfopaludibacter sp. SbA3]|nr:hypothetical protein SBA3_3410003 [Candidatus Sulfopaludibacter sp. SbA3]